MAFTHGKHWDGEVRLDFEHLLEPSYGKGDKKAGDGDGDGDGEEETDGAEFSFLGGGVRASAAVRSRAFGVDEYDDDGGDDDEGVDGDDDGDDGDDGDGDGDGDGVLGDGSNSAAGRRRRKNKDGGGGGGLIANASAATQLAVRAENAVLARAAGSGLAEVRSGAEYLLGRRTYTGLEPGPKRGEDGAAADAPLEAAEGLKGRAHGYSNERG